MKRILLLSFLLVSLTGCSQMVSRSSGKHEISSSLVDFLYPDKNSRVKHREALPLLKLPVKVGIAFVPSRHWRGQQLSQAQQQRLLNKVKASFGQHRTIDSISIIPSVYLQKGRGFDALDQVARLHNVDLMALVSYDQVTRSHHNNAALLYWTIVGMYVIPGNSNHVETFVDTAVFDVHSRKLLLRAPGVSSVKRISTAIGVDSVIQQQSTQGFNLAFDDMIVNLNAELNNFKERVKQGHVASIQHRQGYSAAGSFDGAWLLLLGFSALLIRAKKRA